MESSKYKLTLTKAEVKPPCSHKLFFPPHLGREAASNNKSFAFHHLCPTCFKKNLIAIEGNHAYFRPVLDMYDLHLLYELLQGKEHEFADHRGLFFCKEIASYKDIENVQIGAEC